MHLIISLLLFSSCTWALESGSLINRKSKALQNTQDATDHQMCSFEYHLLRHKKSVERPNIIFKNIISHDATIVVAASKNQIELFNSSLQPQAALSNEDVKNPNKDLMLSALNKTLVVLKEKNCSAFDVETQKETNLQLKCPAKRAVFIDENIFAAATLAGISLYDLRIKQEVECVDHKKNTVNALDNLEKETLLASGYTNGLVSLWDLRNPEKPLHEWSKNTSQSHRIMDLVHTDKHIIWLNDEYRLSLADSVGNDSVVSYKLPYKNKGSHHHPCLSKVNAHIIALAYKDRIRIIDLSSYQFHSVELKGELPHTLYEMAGHDEFYVTTHLCSITGKNSTIQKWTLATQEEVDFIEKKTITPKKNN
ncbi:hypothetical protein Noda2021_10780 [Candidatus Dependentiae bacterium Noda2021]|nr:hypothetical protein Noda2021_10780 [Candidatus Dependentiae bacterium Noda2021]